MERQKRRKKSLAKAVGVKSTFVLGHRILMTSFGEKNIALEEKNISETGTVKNLRSSGAYDAAYTPSVFRVKRNENRLSAGVANPLYTTKHRLTDRTKNYREKCAAWEKNRKEQYELAFFGKTFDDNIHIQLISKVLDIEKVFSVTLGNIVYAFNNLDRDADPEHPRDYIGITATGDDLKKLIPNSIYLFGEELELFDGSKHPRLTADEKAAEKERIEARNEILFNETVKVLRAVRNDTFHGFDYNNKKPVKIPKKKYLLSNKDDDFLCRVDAPFTDKLAEVKRDFLQNSRVNVRFICKLLYHGEPTREEIRHVTETYFSFAVLKDFKNTGFSLTVLREALLEQVGLSFEDAGNLRPRMNSFCDFLLYDYYTDRHPAESEALVARLRGCTDEEEKETVYRETAEQLLPDFRPALIKIAGFDAAYISDKSVKDLSGLIGDISIAYPFENRYLYPVKDMKARKNADHFCNLCYYLTRFLDGKEINIFLTELVHIFENMDSFLRVLKSQKLPCEFVEDFAMLGEADYIAARLRTAVSLARMKKSMDCYNGRCLKDAISVLGISKSHRDLSMDDYMEKYLFDDGKKASGGKADHNLRNFLVTNVVRSRKFNYLMRYTNPQTVCDFARNKSLVRFVLKRVEPSMILRYYETIHGKDSGKDLPTDQQIRELTDSISDMNIDRFTGVRNDEGAGETAKAVRNQMRGIVGLYLNVLYQIAKNLMYVNSRYVLAFSFAERDLIVSKLAVIENRQISNYIGMTEYYLQEGMIKTVTPEIRENAVRFGKNEEERRRASEALNHVPGEYLHKNMESYDAGAEKTFRNAVAHLAMLARAPIYASDLKTVKSYYQLYHFCMQKHLLYSARQNGKTSREDLQTVLEQAEAHGDYSKDAVKILCLPFAYNQARYKSLSIEALFDWSEYGKENE